MKKKLFITSLAVALMSIFITLPVFATEETNTNNETNSSFNISIPKNLKDSGKSGKLQYTITVEGNIASDEVLIITPDEYIILYQDGKPSIRADITQTKTVFKSAELDNNAKAETTGSIEYSVSAGIWNGTFNFNINLTEEDSEDNTLGKETPWNYYTAEDGTSHRNKTMYDGTKVDEVNVIIGPYSIWGYFDEQIEEKMNIEVVNMLNKSVVYKPYNINIAYREDARINAVAYAILGGSDMAYHANFGGLPNIENDKLWITLCDGYNADNYIGCFVVDGYQENSDYTYGQYWKSWYGTYYASGNF